MNRTHALSLKLQKALDRHYERTGDMWPTHKARRRNRRREAKQ